MSKTSQWPVSNDSMACPFLRYMLQVTWFAIVLLTSFSPPLYCLSYRICLQKPTSSGNDSFQRFAVVIKPASQSGFLFQAKLETTLSKAKGSRLTILWKKNPIASRKDGSLLSSEWAKWKRLLFHFRTSDDRKGLETPYDVGGVLRRVCGEHESSRKKASKVKSPNTSSSRMWRGETYVTSL